MREIDCAIAYLKIQPNIINIVDLGNEECMVEVGCGEIVPKTYSFDYKECKIEDLVPMLPQKIK